MPKKILIVDDEIKEYKKCKLALSPYSHDLQLFYANHGPSAIDRINTIKPDLIFLDQVFYKENVFKGNLFYKNEDTGTIVQHKYDDAIAVNDEQKQGLYIIEKIRDQGFQGWVVFLTAHAGMEIAKEALRLGDKNTDYISKDRLIAENKDDHVTMTLENRDDLIPIIEQKLSMKLISFQQRVKNVLNQYYTGIPKQEEELFIDALVSRAETKRRRGLAFVETVLKRLKATCEKITFSILSSAIDNTIKEDEWKSESANSSEILNWVLARLDYSGLPTDEKEWYFVGFQTLHYTYRVTINGKSFFLKIIHPKYSRDIASDKPDESKLHKAFSLPCNYSFELGKEDPEWEGKHVAIYFEEATDAMTLKEYVEKKCPLNATTINDILCKLTTIMKSLPAGHGMLGTDFIYVENNNSVRVSNHQLWDYVTEEGRQVIEGLTLPNRNKRDVQSLGIVADTLLTGHAGGLELITNGNAFFDFLEKCKSGVWCLENSIPQPPTNVLFIPSGSPQSQVENGLLYLLKQTLYQENINALVYLNPNIHFEQKLITNEVDALIVTPNQYYIIDVKGRRFEQEKDEYFKKIKVREGNVKNLWRKMGFDNECILARIVLNDNTYRDIVSKLNAAEKVYTLSFTALKQELIDRNLKNKTGIYDLSTVRRKLSEYVLPWSESPYEKINEFCSRFGNPKYIKSSGFYDELSSPQYYFRRYSLSHISDRLTSLTSPSEIRSILAKIQKKQELAKRLNSSLLLLPTEILLINYDNHLLLWDDVSPPIDCGRPPAVVRWIYEVFPKHGDGWEIPLSIPSNLPTRVRKKLVCDYLEVSMSLIKEKVDIGKDSLKVFLKDNDYYGIIDLETNENSKELGKRHLEMILDCLRISDGNIKGSLKPFDSSDVTTKEAIIKKMLERLKQDINKHTSQETLLGRVDWFDALKGFGFILAPIDGKEIKFHVYKSDVIDKISLCKNDHVEFVKIDGDKGPRAVSVRKISEAKPHI